jgi:porphobilinogen synthase
MNSKSRNENQNLVLAHRPRRLRKTSALRDMVEETHLGLSQLIFPLFLVPGTKKKIEVKSMPGIFRFSLDEILKEIESCRKLGLHSFVLFPAIEDEKKNKKASEALNSKGLYPKAISEIKKRFPDLTLMTDVALDPYNSDGHDGLVEYGKIKNDETVSILAEMAVLHAGSGADIVGPSDMMDGRVGAIRMALEEQGHSDTLIMAYTAKYASSFYGPFRDALDSAPKSGDKKSYQMNPANRREAGFEASLDLSEGADILMVKPALSYLDIISDLKSEFPLPIAAYNVSGEYSMIKASAQKGWIDHDKAMIETLTSIRRAGADIILTYFAKELAEKMKRGKS